MDDLVLAPHGGSRQCPGWGSLFTEHPPRETACRGGRCGRMSQTGAQGGQLVASSRSARGLPRSPAWPQGLAGVHGCQRAHSHMLVVISIKAPREQASYFRERRELCPSQTSRQNPAWAAARAPQHAPHGARGLGPAQEGAAAVSSQTGVSKRAASSVCLLPSRTPRALPPSPALLPGSGHRACYTSCGRLRGAVTL